MDATHARGAGAVCGGPAAQPAADKPCCKQELRGGAELTQQGPLAGSAATHPEAPRLPRLKPRQHQPRH
eukprot:2881223-Pyramimonas_sp.AAC.1